MRISTLDLYNQGISSIDSAETTLAQTQETISTGKSVNKPSDNPIASTEIVQLSTDSSMNAQYATNISTAKSILGQADSTLSQVNDVLQTVSSTLVSAGNGGLGASDRNALATQLQSQLNQLVSLANTQAPDGTYLFGGYSASTPPFSQSAGVVSYNGDEGTRAIQVSGSRLLPVSASGDAVFQRIRNGNGVFVTGSAASNTGTATIDTGSVTDPSALTGHDYSISFAVNNGATTYSVVDTSTGEAVDAPAATNNTYTAGTAITIDGMAVTISGAPANGDSFSIAPSQNQSVFTTIQQAIQMLQTPANGSPPNLGSLQTAIQNVDQAMANTSSVQTTVGTNEAELSNLSAINTAASTSDTTQISNLQSTDLAAAASNLSEQELVLSAAEQSFAKISGDSLFNYLK